MTTSLPVEERLTPDTAPWRLPSIKKRKICLVIPPSEFLLDDRVFPSLGVLKVAAVCEAAGHSVDVLDLSDAPLLMPTQSDLMYNRGI